MPYKDPEKRKKAVREAMKRQREREQEQAEASAATIGLGDRPTVADAESANGNRDKEAEIEARLVRTYGKSHTWACVMYQDSAPADWEDKLRMIGVAFAVSPLHDQDITQTGDLKKAHWHVILHWPGGATTYRTAAGISKGILRGTIPIPLVSPRGYYRYFTHLDNPNKAQYDAKNIVVGNGFDVGDFLELTSQEKNDLRKKLLEIVINSGFTEYWELITYTMYNEDNATFAFVCDNSLFWQVALRSKRFMERGQ